jgi:hypothetical protein
MRVIKSYYNFQKETPVNITIFGKKLLSEELTKTGAGIATILIGVSIDRR